MPFVDGMGLPADIDTSLSRFALTDMKAAEHLLNRVSRQVAEVMEVGDVSYAQDLMPIYRWLQAVVAEETTNRNADLTKEKS
ncbi:MAG: hypothetical protein AAFR98_11960 [Pseudomonadota bacterium]